MKTIHDFVAGDVPPFVKGKMLDVGGGWGRWKNELERYAESYTIADLPEEDARALSFRDASFDTVVCFEVLEHVDDTRKVISEMYRVLKPGGFAIATAPFTYPEHANPGDYYRFTPQGFRFLFEQAGFTVREVRSIGNIWTVLGVILKAKMKEHGRAGHRVRANGHRVLHAACCFLSERALPDPHFFTHSAIVVQRHTS